MSAAPEHFAAEPRPYLRVIHSNEPTGPTAVPHHIPDGQQQELPLRWPADRHGESAAAGLARYPALALDRGVPRPDPFVAHVATLVADVLAGARPAKQLARCASLEVQLRLARRGAATLIRQPWSGGSARVSSTSTMVVSGLAVQVVVVFIAGTRAHAAALRMEYRHRRWLVTDIQWAS